LLKLNFSLASAFKTEYFEVMSLFYQKVKMLHQSFD